MELGSFTAGRLWAYAARNGQSEAGREAACPYLVGPGAGRPFRTTGNSQKGPGGMKEQVSARTAASVVTVTLLMRVRCGATEGLGSQGCEEM